MKNFIQLIKASPVAVWCLIFIISNMLSRGVAWTNPRSRHALLRSMSEMHTFRIDNYLHFSGDWAKTPDGHYYSNKAPGPALIIFPLFWVTEQITKLQKGVTFNEFGQRNDTISATPRALLSIVGQVLPCALLVLLFAAYLKRQSVSVIGIHLFALATLFGNTASVFMKDFFGHGMVAVLLLTTLLFFLQKKNFWVGFFYGFTLLSDYSAALILPLIVTTLFLQNRKRYSWIKPFMLGGIVPGLLWIWYHVSCFGSPWAIANHFQNPDFQDMKQLENNLWGIFTLSIRPNIIFELLFGSARGMLFTVPWVLLLIPTSLYYSYKNLQNRQLRYITLISCVGLLLLLIMNSSFGGWHGGGSAGPRYLSMIFPLFAVGAAIQYQYLSPFSKYTLGITIAISVIFYSLVMATGNPTIGMGNIWGTLWREIQKIDGPAPYIRLSLFWVMMLFGCWWIFKKRNFFNSPNV